MKKTGTAETRTETVVDEYIRQLGDLGISLKELKILGDFEFPEEDKDLSEEELIEKILTDDSYKEQKKLIEKYISEFVRADLITQSIHRRKGEQLVNKNNEDWIDGGVYLYRTKQSTDISGALSIDNDGEEYIKEVGGSEYVQMQYVTPEEWKKLKNEENPKIRYRYTIDQDTGELIIAKVKTVETIEGDISNSLNKWFEDAHLWLNENLGAGADSTEVIIEGEERIDYKAYISEYTMPYEFLITLCEITQNPEFVYHVALLARETKIILAVQDDTTVEKVITERENKYESYENGSDSSTSGASKTDEKTEKTRKITITTTTDPHIQLEYANTWSFYKEVEYTKNINTQTETNGPTTEAKELPVTLENYQPEQEVERVSYEGVIIKEKVSEKWYDTFCVETTTATETTITTSIYNPGIEKNSVEKSKQFLGLLRDEDGECNYDCEEHSNQAKYCAEDAVFDRNGINVVYRIPNSTREEMPLNKLLSGEQMLYDLLGESIEGDENLSPEEDYNSQYKTKMSGLVDHIKYLLTFPDNENINILYDIDEPLDDEEYEQINVDDVIVKTDESGAIRPVTKEELVGIINVTFSGQEKENALSIVNTLIDCQDKYKVNAVFVLAFAHQESNIGTANTKWVRQNNWLSWALGTSYSSPQENVETVMRGMAEGSYYFTQGKITIKDIGYTYCPNTSDYPTQGDCWVRNVTTYVKKMYEKLGINIDTADVDDNAETYTVNGHTYKNYKQDSGASWSGNSFAGGTMKSSGCSITSVAIVLTGYGYDINPEEIRQEVNGKATNLSNLLNKYGISTNVPGRALNADEIISHLQEGKPIIVNVNGEWTSSTGHYMVLLDYKNENGKDMVYVSNPGTVNSSKNGWVEISRITNNMKTRSIFITSD